MDYIYPNFYYPTCGREQECSYHSLYDMSVEDTKLGYETTSVMLGQNLLANAYFYYKSTTYLEEANKHDGMLKDWTTVFGGLSLGQTLINAANLALVKWDRDWFISYIWFANFCVETGITIFAAKLNDEVPELK